MGLEKKWHLNEGPYSNNDDVICFTSSQTQYYLISAYRCIIFENNIYTMNKMQLEMTNGSECGYLLITTNLCTLIMVLFATIRINKNYDPINILFSIILNLISSMMIMVLL